MIDLSQDSLLREIDEDIRRERYARLWKRFGGWIIAIAVAVLLGVAGYQFWQFRTQKQQQEASARFAAAVALATTDRAAAERQFAAIAADGPAGFAVLAGLRQAALLAQNGDTQAAHGVYQQVERKATDPFYRDLAVVREAMLALQDETVPIDAEAITDRLKPLSANGNPWRFTARELSAVLASRTGQTTEARDVLSGLANDQLAPSDMRERARQLLAELGER
ncbi:MAG: tetratricopeptide repeat protein [Rhodospirillales bacterium]|nr:tetratricopeptide repeat protein [Rhodospirillales bacterium]